MTAAIRDRLQSSVLGLLALSAALPAWVGAAAAEEWPQFRGPTGQGISSAKGLPIAWSEKENIVFKQPIPGEGWSSPIVHKGRVYLTAAVARAELQRRSGAKPTGKEAAGGMSLRALCLDARSGKPQWNVEVFLQPADSPRIHSKNSHASATPLIHGDRLYVHFGHEGTACLDLAGRVLWRNASLRYPPVHGNGGSPVVVSDVLAMSCDGASDPFVAALDLRTGKVRWKTPRTGETIKKFAFSTPLWINVAGRKQIVSPGAGSVGGFDPGTGREIWRVRYDGYSVVPRPVFGHGLVFISTGFDSPEVLAIRPDGQGDVTDTHVSWRLSKGAPNTPSMLLVGEELYMVSDRGVATCVEARTGKVHWSERVGGAFSASPLFAEGRIYLQDEQGTGVVLRAGRTFERLAENPLNERSLASLATVDGALFIRTEKHLFRIEEPSAGK